MARRGTRRVVLGQILVGGAIEPMLEGWHEAHRREVDDNERAESQHHKDEQAAISPRSRLHECKFARESYDISENTSIDRFQK